MKRQKFDIVRGIIVQISHQKCFSDSFTGRFLWDEGKKAPKIDWIIAKSFLTCPRIEIMFQIVLGWC